MVTSETIKVGQRVRMRRSHDRIEFTGRIVSVSTKEPICGVETEAGNGSIAHHETAHFNDVTILEQPAEEPKKPAEIVLTEHQRKFLKSRGYAGDDPEASAFINSLDERERDGFLEEAARWQERQDQGGTTDAEKKEGEKEEASDATAQNATA